MQAVIMAGGKGTRLAQIAQNIPKPMIPVMGKPILQYQIENLKANGISDITIIIGHMGAVIRDFFADGERFGVNIRYITEENPLGTAGGLFYLKDSVQEDFILLFGDIFLDIDFLRMAEFHRKREAFITLLVHPNSHPYDSDLVLINRDYQVTGWSAKNSVRTTYEKNIVNAGVYIVSPRIFPMVPSAAKLDFEKDIVLPCIRSGQPVYAYCSSEYVKDIGTPERYYAAVEDVKNKIHYSRNLLRKQKCIFLDRDGTINELHGFINSTDRFFLLPEVSEAVKLINSSQYLCIIVTNQPVLARGECSFEELHRIHCKLETLLGEDGAYVDAIYFCPHHPDGGFIGEIANLKIPCQCRKPQIGMLLQAAADFNIDLSASWIIGDTTTDIQTGINGGLHTALILTGEAGQDHKYDAQPDLTGQTLYDAVEMILKGDKLNGKF